MKKLTVSAIFMILMLAAATISVSAAEGTAWEDDLESDGEYKFVVSTEKKSSYTLKLKID